MPEQLAAEDRKKPVAKMEITDEMMIQIIGNIAGERDISFEK